MYTVLADYLDWVLFLSRFYVAFLTRVNLCVVVSFCVFCVFGVFSLRHLSVVVSTNEFDYLERRSVMSSGILNPDHSVTKATEHCQKVVVHIFKTFVSVRSAVFIVTSANNAEVM